jgi:capsular exopolysaccharide synthesis family protein
MKKLFKEQVGDMQLGGGKSVELEFARAELAREEKVFEEIASRKLSLQTESRAPTRVLPQQPAREPLVPLEKLPYKLMVLACCAAFIAPFAAAVAREITVRRINDSEQLAQESRMRILGEISMLPVRHVAASPRKLLPGLRRAAYVFAESINSLRTNLAVASDLRGRQVVAVTSAASGEGKTSVATSLAMSIADTTGTQTLIIDGDMRSPDVAAMLKTPNAPGLFDFLSNNCSLDEAIHRVGDGDLYVMPAGRATKNPHLVLKLESAQRLLDQLRSRFSTIVVDTPPILGASESLLLAKAADMAIFCSMCDVSRAKQVRLAVERLEHAGVNVAGAVLSGTPARRYAHVYGYYVNEGESVD